MGPQLVDWVEVLLCHGPGDLLGQDLDLDGESKQFVDDAYRLRDDGSRWVTRAVLSRAKGWAKSEKAGVLGCAEGVGPVRFDHWAVKGETSWWGYQYEKGEPVGRPVVSPEVLCVATEEGQAGNTYDNIVVMLRHLVELVPEQFVGLDIGLTRVNIPGGGTIEPISSAATSKDGGKSTFVVFDETHLWILLQLRRLHRTIYRNLGKRKLAEPWGLDTSTMYSPGEESVAEASHKFAEAILDRRLKDPHFLFDHREGFKDFDWDDDDQLLAALTEAYGDTAEWQDLARKIIDIRRPDVLEADSRRYMLNLATPGVGLMVDPDQWDAKADPALELVEGDAIAVGFDGSQTDDATALVACRMSDEALFVLGIWEREAALPPDAAWHVDVTDVDLTVEAAFEKYDVVRMYCDPPYWQTWVSQWAGLHGDKVVVEWATWRPTPMHAAHERFREDLASGNLCHDGNGHLARHVKNAVRHVRPNGKATAQKPTQARKIDGYMAAVLAVEARADAIAAGWTDADIAPFAIFT